MSGARVTKYAIGLKPDLVHFHDPELIAHSLLRRFGSTKVVFDAHEDFVTQTEGKDWASGANRLLVKALGKTLRASISLRADHLVVATSGVGRDYPEAKTTVIRNVPIMAEFPSDRPRVPLPERPADVCYVGSLSKFRGVVEMINAAAHCPQIRTLHLAGRFEPAALEFELQSLAGWSKVEYHGYINRTQIADLLDRVRAGLLLLHPLPNFVDSLPIKLLEYRAAGVPMLASDFDYWTEFVTPGETGEFVDPTDETAIAEILNEMVSDEAAALYEEQYAANTGDLPSWESEVVILEGLYEQVIAG